MTLEWCVGAYEDWYEQTRDEREASLRDIRYYHHDQRSKEELDELDERGQPPSVNNRIARKINTVLGDEAEKGIDPYCKPRTPEGEDDARAMTDGTRFTADEAGFDSVRRAVTLDLLVPGIAACIIEGDGSPNGPTAPTSPVDYDLLWWDPRSRLVDFSDDKYRGLAKWFDIEDAVDDYHDKKKELESSIDRYSSHAHEAHRDKPLWADTKRKRVCVVEIYVRYGGNCWKACFVRSAFVLEPTLTGYIDDDGNHVCPLEMVRCYVNKISDDRISSYGMVRGMISPQDMINKRESKAMDLLVRRQVMREQNAVPDPYNFQTELTKPDGDLVVQDGAMTGNKVKILDGTELAMAQMQMLNAAKQDIDNVGPQASNIPELPMGASGIALETRTKAASRELSPIAYALKDWGRRVFTQYIWRIKQFRQDEWWMRITDDSELTGYRFSALNRRMTRAERLRDLLGKEAPLKSAMAAAAGELAPVIIREAGAALKERLAALGPAAQQIPPEKQEELMIAAIERHPLMSQQIVANQAAKANVDLVVDETPDTGTIAERQFQELVRMAPAMQTAGVQIPPELWIEASSLPDKRKLREIVEAGKKPDPKAEQLKMQVAALEMALKQAQAQLLGSQAAKNNAEAQAKQVDTQTKAGAAKIGTAETVAGIGKTKAETDKIRAETTVLTQPEVAIVAPGGF